MSLPAESSRHFYNVSQARMHQWDALKHSAHCLAQDDADHRREHQELITSALAMLGELEHYWAYPGVDKIAHLQRLFKDEHFELIDRYVKRVISMMTSEAFRSFPFAPDVPDATGMDEDDEDESESPHYFEVLFVGNIQQREQERIRAKMADIRQGKDDFVFDIIFVPSYQDALIALEVNPSIQACVLRYGIEWRADHCPDLIRPFVAWQLREDLSQMPSAQLAVALSEAMHRFRPELDIYYVTDSGLNHLHDDVFDRFRRVFYSKEDLQELHLSIQRGIKERFQTPFFSALCEYSRKPTSVFHAMPISRGNSVFKSHWIKDLGEFYGRNLFLAETSATTGGLDSLLQPTGPLKQAQELAAKAFGARQTYFATNGTSTANKIVLQALIQPGDVVLVDRDCHKSHHYGLMLAGATAVYLDSYPIPEYSMYGAVPLTHIKEKLLTLKAAGRLSRVKMLLLTNCTFDGLVYNVQKVMEEVLAIKPDMIFLWDEAWFGFAAFTPTYRQRTAMHAAKTLHEKYHSAEYASNFAAKSNGKLPEAMPDPVAVRIRVYATQSTHKTLSSFRQGSMIHIWDEDFERKSSDAFHEAYMTHTSTSANYQILASLDVGRRQAQFEGYELVEKSLEMAMVLRARINDHPLLKQYFDVLTVSDFIPLEHRKSGIQEYYDPAVGWNKLQHAWHSDDFVLDPTKINLFIGRTGVDGDTFKNRYLMDRFAIQINKTSRNTVLFMTNIGTTRSSTAYLFRALLDIARLLQKQEQAMNAAEIRLHKKAVKSLTVQTPPLPDFSSFHHSFQAVPGVPGGDLRSAYFLAFDEKACEYRKVESCYDMLKAGKDVVSASFVIPYPPGFPILVPGQVVSKAILDFLVALDVNEIHGLRPKLGLKVFTTAALEQQRQKNLTEAGAAK